ncbi:MAG: Holliday junction branch migration protein RuvA [Kiritimatiellae bacterium]|nr:Holliday junction branch migration protein RuvA [Kiritimatiellia bacterium]
MITFLNGTLVEKCPTRIVLDVNGVGYEVLIPLSSYNALPPRNQPCRILTYEYIREDTHQLFGFMTEAEREMFLRLISTNGVGPKLGLSALSGLSVHELRTAIVQGDIGRLSAIRGIGKKTAERIVVELRDKIGQVEATETSTGTRGESEDATKTSDAVKALVALGHKPADARNMVVEAVRGLDTGSLTVEQIIRRALGGRS